MNSAAKNACGFRSAPLKPPSTLAAAGAPVARPPGCELLAFESEVALIIGRRATRVSARDAWDYVAAAKVAL